MTPKLEQKVAKLSMDVQAAEGLYKTSVDVVQVCVGVCGRTVMRNVSFVVHPDLEVAVAQQVSSKSPSSGSEKAEKQKLNTDGSVATELVATHQHTSEMLFASLFSSEQGHGVEENVVACQDNESAMPLGKNGKKST